MYSKFEMLDEEKKQRILNAAMEEFAAKGYDHASTNRIVEAAGIAKGLLFHYFKSKKRLFLYTYDHTVRLFMDEFYAKYDAQERDLFEKLHKIMMIKFDIIQKYSGFLDFVKAAYLEESVEVKKELDERNRGLLSASIARVFQDVDTSKFRPGIDPGLAFKTIFWAYEGYSNDFLQKTKGARLSSEDLGLAIAQADAYTDFLKRCFYQ